MLDYEELEEIIEKVKDAVTQEILLANRVGDLEKLLEGWGFGELIPGASAYETYRDGKIVVIGGSEVKERDLLGIIKDLGLDKNRFEFCLDYDKAKTYQYSKLRYNISYRLVIFGAVPHSSTGKLDSSSVIAEMQNQEGYPRVEVLNANNAVKITKSNFRELLQELIDEDYI